MLVLSPCLLVAGVEDGPSSVLEMLRKRPQSRTKYTQSSPVSRGWWPHQQHEVKISTQCVYTMNVSIQSLSTECIYCIYTALVHHCMAVQQLATLGQANKGGRCWYKVVPPSTIMHSAEADNRQAIHMN